MIFFKEQKDERIAEVEEASELQKAFFEEMSYKMRNPLNAICGIAEIARKNVKENFDREEILQYIDMLMESTQELKEVVDECFSRYERIPEATVDEVNQDDEYQILNNLRVMVAEDSDVNRVVVKQLLCDKGAIVTEVSNGQEAVDLFTRSIFGTYDMILMDINMPNMDGYEATDRIRSSSHPQAKTIPIIAVTGDVYAEDIKMALKSGMNAHIAKPYSFDKLYATIKSVMES